MASRYCRIAMQHVHPACYVCPHDFLHIFSLRTDITPHTQAVEARGVVVLEGAVPEGAVGEALGALALLVAAGPGDCSPCSLPLSLQA